MHKESYRANFFGNISGDDLAGLIRNPPLANDWLETLASMHLLPTPALLSFALSNGKEAKDKLEQARTEIWLGGFNPANPLHVELEYSRYVGESGSNYAGDMSKSQAGGKGETLVF